MAKHSFWKGYLKLSLVTCPVSMAPATSDSAKLRFHTLNRATGNRIEARYVDAVTGKPVEDDDQVKGYEQAADKYVPLEDEELESIALETTRTIDIETFVPARSVGWLWYDKPHYLSPDDPVGEEAFSVIREAMVASDMVGLSRLVLYRRERAVMLQPRDKGIVLWTLRFGDEVMSAETAFADIKQAKADKTALSLVSKLIEARTRDWDPSFVSDPVQENLQAIIEAKSKKRLPPKKKAKLPAAPSNVIDIMDALKKSVSEGKRKKT
jgi:DNA end-binding protein Ku